MRSNRSQFAIHAVLIGLVLMTFLPFIFVFNNSFRAADEINDSFFGVPAALKHLIAGSSGMSVDSFSGTIITVSSPLRAASSASSERPVRGPGATTASSQSSLGRRQPQRIRRTGASGANLAAPVQ